MIEKLMDLIADQKFSGVVTIEKNKDLILNIASGYRERSNQIELNTSTIMGLASGTKLFTALGVLSLVEEGKFSLDDNVFNYIERPYQYEDVTIRQLLSHTSGIPDYYDEDFITDFDNFKVSVPWSELDKPSDYFDVLPDREMKFKPGSGFHYNNSGYILLSILIEKITGDYYEYIYQSVIKKADLNKTGYYRFNQLPANCAYGYIQLGQNQFKTNIYNLPIRGGGDGGIYSTTSDIHKLWHAVMAGKIVSMELVDEMRTNHSPSDEDEYGLGVWLSGKTPWITGADAGVSFVSVYKEELDTIYTILSNTSNGAWAISKYIRENLNELID